jgi:hypothetical protein
MRTAKSDFSETASERLVFSTDLPNYQINLLLVLDWGKNNGKKRM